MTREEKIKEAYGELYRKHQNRIDKNNGSIDAYFLSKDDRDLIEFRTYKLGKGYYYLIPKSIWGIENNNGWNKILEPEDLPEKDKPVFFMEHGNIAEGFFNGKQFICNYGVFGWKTITHYLPITKPHPPITKPHPPIY